MENETGGIRVLVRRTKHKISKIIEELTTNLVDSASCLAVISSSHIGRWRLLLHSCSSRSCNCSTLLAVSALPLVVAVGSRSRCKVTHRRQSRCVRSWSLLVVGSLRIRGVASNASQHGSVFSSVSRCLLLCPVLSSRFREELFEVFK